MQRKSESISGRKRMTLVLLDTNVLISGLFFKGNEHRILWLFLNREFANVMPEHVYFELERVVNRKFSKHPALGTVFEQIEMIKHLSLFIPADQYFAHVNAALDMITDEKDAFVLACALFMDVDVLVTGDKDFHVLRNLPCRVMTSKDFLAGFPITARAQAV